MINNDYTDPTDELRAERDILVQFVSVHPDAADVVTLIEAARQARRRRWSNKPPPSGPPPTQIVNGSRPACGANWCCCVDEEHNTSRNVLPGASGALAPVASEVRDDGGE